METCPEDDFAPDVPEPLPPEESESGKWDGDDGMDDDDLFDEDFDPFLGEDDEFDELLDEPGELLEDELEDD